MNRRVARSSRSWSEAACAIRAPAERQTNIAVAEKRVISLSSRLSQWILQQPRSLVVYKDAMRNATGGGARESDVLNVDGDSYLPSR